MDSTRSWNKWWIWLLGLEFVVLALFSNQVASASAQEGEWIPLHGPHLPGGTVTALALAPSSPNLLYAALGPRLFRSDDAAATWTQVYTATDPFWALAVDPLSPTIAYAGGLQALYKTENGGQTWTQVLTLGAAIAVDPITPANVYAAGSSMGEGIPEVVGVVAKSSDGGTSWMTRPLTDTSRLEAIVVNPVTPTVLYAGATMRAKNGSIIYKSIDGGLSWTSVYSKEWGMPGIRALTIDPLNPQTLYAAGGYGLLKSVDGGLTWTELPGLFDNIYRLALNPQHPETVYVADGWPDSITEDVSLYISFDGGQSWWQSFYRFPAAVYVLIVNPVSPNILYAGLQDFGVYKSSDIPAARTGEKAGALNTWAEVNAGIRTLAAVDALAINPEDPDVLFAASGAGRGGLFRSEDGGATWMTVLTDTPIVSLAINPVTPTSILAGGPAQLYESWDSGTQWHRVYDAESVLSVAFDPLNPDILYAGGREDSIPYPDQGFVARRVRDPEWPWGWHWATVPISCAHQISALAIHPVTTTTILAGGTDQCRGKRDAVHRSRDGGLTWTEVLTEAGWGISDVVFAPHTPDMVFASSELWGVYKSTDGGNTWQRKGDGLGGYGNRALAVDSFGRLYAGTLEGVYWSVDRAEHWAPLGTEMQEGIGSLAIRPGDPTQLLAGTTSGVWRYQVPPYFSIYLPIISKAGP